MTTDVTARNNVQVLGNSEGPVVMFGHGSPEPHNELQGSFCRLDLMPGATLVQLQATGHLPHVSEPAKTAKAILSFLAGTPL